MKLVHDKLSGSLLDDNVYVSNLIIENPIKFYDLVNELRRQCAGLDGGFSLFKGYDLIEICKNVDIFIDPFSINVNNKKAINRLYEHLNQIMNSKFTLSNIELLDKIKEYFNDIIYYCDFDLMYDDNIDFNNLLKIFNFRFNINEEDPLCFKIISYIKIMCDLGVSVFVFVNFLCYLNKEQILEVIKVARYFGVYLLFIDNFDYKYNFFDKRYIIDLDLCEIY